VPTLAFGPRAAVALAAEDGAVIDWLVEFFASALTPTERPTDWRVRLSGSARACAELRAGRPDEVRLRPCFAFDQRVLSLPTWTGESHAGVLVDDAERSCVVAVAPGEVEVVADPASRRWRFLVVLVIHELLGMRLRSTQLELHAAAVQAAGRAIAIIGPKGAGKTTLSLHLVRSGGCSPMANDRAYAGREGDELVVRGVPTAVRLRPATLAAFAELAAPPRLDRPYLHSVAELERAPNGGPPAAGELILSPAQLAHRLAVRPATCAPIGALVFPEVSDAIDGWSVDRLAPAATRTRIWENLFGGASRPREPTLFEDMAGGRGLPSPEVAAELAEAAPGYRVVLGRGAYARRDFAGRFLASLDTA
jgi:hypothetical protein